MSTGFNYFTSSGDQAGSSTNQFYATLSPEIDFTLGEPATGKVISFQYFGSLSLGDTDGRSTPYDQSFDLRRRPDADQTDARSRALSFRNLPEATGTSEGATWDRELLSLALTGNYQYSVKSSFESDLTVPIRIFRVRRQLPRRDQHQLSQLRLQSS